MLELAAVRRRKRGEENRDYKRIHVYFSLNKPSILLLLNADNEFAIARSNLFYITERPKCGGDGGNQRSQDYRIRKCAYKIGYEATDTIQHD